MKEDEFDTEALIDQIHRRIVELIALSDVS